MAWQAGHNECDELRQDSRPEHGLRGFVSHTQQHGCQLVQGFREKPIPTMLHNTPVTARVLTTVKADPPPWMRFRCVQNVDGAGSRIIQDCDLQADIHLTKILD